MRDRRQPTWHRLGLLLCCALAVSAIAPANPLMPLAFVAVGVMFLLTLVNTNAAIVILLASMLLSPELNIASVPSRQVVIRLDDFLLLAIVFSWLAKMAMRQELKFMRWTELHGPVLLLFLWCVVATVFGFMSGEITSPPQSLFYLLKYFEYFLVFFLGVNVIRDQDQCALFWRAFLVTALCVGAYGWWQGGSAVRVSAPFEGEKGEPNTLAGYLLLVMGVVLGRAAFAPTSLRCLQLAGVAAFLFVPFLNTLSRGGYIGFLVMYVLLLLLAPRRKLWFAIPLLLAILVGPTLFPEAVIERVRSTFLGATPYGTIGERLGLDPSAAQRVDIWFYTYDLLKKHPLIGYGVSGAGLIDHQYCLVLAELGLIGGVIYLWTRWVIWRVGWHAYRALPHGEWRGFVLGYLCAYAGLLVHSFAGNIFIIVRIMEPFWFLTAVVLTLPRVLATHHAASPQPMRVT